MRPANLAAVNRIEAWLDASIDVHKTIGVETVLSTELGFEIWLIYVVLGCVNRNVERVKLRARKGGHDVAEDDIRRRHARSLQQFPWFLEQADRAWIYDNSGAKPKRIGEKIDGVITLDEKALPIIVNAIRSIETP